MQPGRFFKGRRDDQTGRTQDIPVPQMPGNVIIAVHAVKGRISGVNAVFPFGQHGSVIVPVQIGHMHLGQIRGGGGKIIQRIVHDGFPAVWHIAAQGILKPDFRLTGKLPVILPGFQAVQGAIGAKICVRTQHAVVKKAQAGRQGAVKGPGGIQGGMGSCDDAPMLRCTYGQKDGGIRDLVQPVCEGEQAFFIHVTGAVHFSPGTGKDTL